MVEQRLVRYPEGGKPLAPRFLAPILDVPVMRFHVESVLPRGAVLADLDLEASSRLPAAAHRRLARATYETVRERWRTIAHRKPFADMPEGLQLLKLPIGTNTRSCLALIPAPYLPEMDVGALFEIRGFGPKSLLDVTSAIEAWDASSVETDSEVAPDVHQDDFSRVDVLVELLPPEARRGTLPLPDPRASLPLDAVVRGAPIARPGLWLVDHWEDLSASCLPEPAARVAQAGDTAQDVLAALVSPASLQEGAERLLDDLSTRLRVPARQWEITLARNGLSGDSPRTLAAIGDQLGVTRERVRQLALPRSALQERVRPDDRLALSLQAWFALNPGRPLAGRVLGDISPNLAVEQAARLVLDGLRFPSLDHGDRFWVARGDELRALRAIAVRPNLGDEAISGEAVARTADELPGIEGVLDVAYTVAELTMPASGVRQGQTSGATQPSGGVVRSLVPKIVTYLVNRAAPVDVDELAGVIEARHWPFDSLDLTSVDPAYLRVLADAHPDLLECSDDGQLRLGPARAARSPSGNVGIVYRILRDAGAPVPTARLKELARMSGIGSNTLGVLVHGNRAPCVIPLARGMVGLVGRDEHWLSAGAHARPASPADDPNCYLLPEGWAVKVPIDEDLLRGGTWDVPPRLADHLGFRRRRVVRLTSDRPVSRALLLEPKVHSCIGRSIGPELRSLGAVPGDSVFVVLKPDAYGLLLRSRDELGEGDPLRRLLANCGLDPEVTIAANAWSRLARALGATSGDRSAIRDRFRVRGQADMLELLDATQRGAGRSEAWPVGWSYTASLDEETSRYALRSARGAVRVAVGVARPGGPAPDHTIVAESGIVWLDVDDTDDRVDATALVSEMHGTTPDAAWARWARAEHAARKVALSGVAWEIRVVDRGYAVEGDAYDDLPTALESVGARQPLVETVAPSEKPRHRYPRGALAFAQAERGARRRGLLMLSADPAAGFRAAYRNGVIATGPTLADVLLG